MENVKKKSASAVPLQYIHVSLQKKAAKRAPSDLPQSQLEASSNFPPGADDAAAVARLPTSVVGLAGVFSCWTTEDPLL